MSVQLELAGLEPLRAWLRQAAGRLAGRGRLHQRAGRAVTDWIGRNFESEGRLAGEGSPWPPLARATLEARRRRGLGTRILQATGRLRAGTGLHSDGGQALVANPVPYAQRHQLGLGLPARPFFPTPAQARRIVDPVVEAFIAEALE